MVMEVKAVTKKLSLLTPISDAVKRAQIHENTYVRLTAINSPVLARRNSLEQLETEISEISAQAQAASERVATMRDALESVSSLSNGSPKAEEASD